MAINTNPPVPFPTAGLIRQNTGGAGWRRDLWTPNAFDYNVFEDNFWGASLNVLYPAAKASGGTVTFTEHNNHGFLEFKSGSNNDEYAGQGLGLQFTGDRGFLAEFLVKVPASVADFKFEVGVTDDDSSDAGVVTLKQASPTVKADEAAVLVFDTDDDTTFSMVSVKAGGTAVEKAVTKIGSAVASRVYIIAMRVVPTDYVELYMSEVGAGAGPMQRVAAQALALEGSVALTPWVFCQTRTGGEKILELHKWRVTEPAF